MHNGLKKWTFETAAGWAINEANVAQHSALNSEEVKVENRWWLYASFIVCKALSISKYYQYPIR